MQCGGLNPYNGRCEAALSFLLLYCLGDASKAMRLMGLIGHLPHSQTALRHILPRKPYHQVDALWV
jgi:hypothetical protein